MIHSFVFDKFRLRKLPLHLMNIGKAEPWPDSSQEETTRQCHREKQQEHFQLIMGWCQVNVFSILCLPGSVDPKLYEVLTLGMRNSFSAPQHPRPLDEKDSLIWLKSHTFKGNPAQWQYHNYFAGRQSNCTQQVGRPRSKSRPTASETLCSNTTQ